MSDSDAAKVLSDYVHLLTQVPRNEIIALDRAHNLLLFGMIASRKPRRVLELGIGTGFVSFSVMLALRYNGVGTLTSVDNWMDTGGQEPPHGRALKFLGAQVVAPMDEREFVHAAKTDAYDLLVSDADHFRSGSWVDEHLRIVEHDGFLFFHDTNQPKQFPNLQLIEERVRALGLPHFHFRESTRGDESCDRGWLFVINKKQ